MSAYEYRIVIGGSSVRTGNINAYNHQSAAKKVREKITIVIKDKDNYITKHKVK